MGRLYVCTVCDSVRVLLIVVGSLTLAILMGGARIETDEVHATLFTAKVCSEGCTKWFICIVR